MIADGVCAETVNWHINVDTSKSSKGALVKRFTFLLLKCITIFSFFSSTKLFISFWLLVYLKI